MSAMSSTQICTFEPDQARTPQTPMRSRQHCRRSPDWRRRFSVRSCGAWKSSKTCNTTIGRLISVHVSDREWVPLETPASLPEPMQVGSNKQHQALLAIIRSLGMMLLWRLVRSAPFSPSWQQVFAGGPIHISACCGGTQAAVSPLRSSACEEMQLTCLATFIATLS